MTTTPPLLYPVAESFYSLQGEGFHSGAPAFFVRLAGCNVGCQWCDSKDSWSVRAAACLPAAAIARQAAAAGAARAVVTGGEPLMHHLAPLCIALKNAGLALHLETSGAYAMSGRWDWIALSPKRQMPPLPAVFPLANELKAVIAAPADLEWAEQNAALCPKQCRLFLQPEWSSRRTAVPLIIQYAKAHPKWRLSVQMHKLVGIR